MSFPAANLRLRSRWTFAVAGGLLLTAGFPNLNVAGCAWVAPAILAGAALGRGAGERWRIGYLGGLVHYLTMLYWLLLIPYRWHGLPLAPALGWVALSGFLALFPATWVWLVTAPPATLVGFAGKGSTGVDEKSERVTGPMPQTYGAELPRSWVGRTLWALWGAAAWVALEMVLARIFGGFPWDLLGVSQYRMVPLIQIASWTGVYGVSFLVVWVSLALLCAGVMVFKRPTGRGVWIREMFLPLLSVAIVFNQGLSVLRHAPARARVVRIILVQPSIPQELIWNSALDTNRFSALVAFTDQVLTNPCDLVVWPESAVPKMLRYDQATFDAISGLARKHKVWLIAGSDDAEPRPGGKNGEADYFNSSFLFTPEGHLAERYIKRNLVIFGEYVPLQQWLPFLGWFTPTQGGFVPGSGPVPFHLENLDVTAAVLICFEDTFPHLSSSGKAGRPDLLVNITNDGWFGRSAAQWQHATTALFRTVENRLPLVRCCNNGVSCWIDEWGRMRQVLRDPAGTVYGMGFLAAEVPLGRTGEPERPTFYSRHGDIFGWVCVLVTSGVALGGLASRLIRRRGH